MTFNISNTEGAPLSPTNTQQDPQDKNFKRSEAFLSEQEKSTGEVALTIMRSDPADNSLNSESPLPSLSKRLKKESELSLNNDEAIFPSSKRRKLDNVQSTQDLTASSSDREISIDETTPLSIRILTREIRKNSNITAIRIGSDSSLSCENQQEFEDFINALCECPNLADLKVCLIKSEKPIEISVQALDRLVQNCKNLKSLNFQGIQINEPATTIFKILLENLKLESLTLKDAGLYDQEQGTDTIRILDLEEEMRLLRSDTLRILDLSNNPNLVFPLTILQNFLALESLNLSNTFEGVNFIFTEDKPKLLSILNSLQNLTHLFLKDIYIISAAQIAKSNLRHTLKKLVIEEDTLVDGESRAGLISLIQSTQLEELGVVLLCSSAYDDDESLAYSSTKISRDLQLIAALPTTLKLLEIHNLRIDREVWRKLCTIQCSHLILKDFEFLEDLSESDEPHSSVKTLQLGSMDFNLRRKLVKSKYLIPLFPQLENLIFFQSADKLSLQQKKAIIQARHLKKILFNCDDLSRVQKYEGKNLEIWKTSLTYIKVGGLFIPNLFLRGQEEGKPISQDNILDHLAGPFLDLENLLILGKYAHTHHYSNLTQSLRELINSLRLSEKEQLLLIDQPLYLEAFKLFRPKISFRLEWIMKEASLENLKYILPHLNLDSQEIGNYLQKIPSLPCHWNRFNIHFNEIFILTDKMCLLFKHLETELRRQAVIHFIDLFSKAFELGLEENRTVEKQLEIYYEFKATKASLYRYCSKPENENFIDYFFYQSLLKYNYDNETPIHKIFWLIDKIPSLHPDTLFLHKELDTPLWVPFFVTPINFGCIIKRPEKIEWLVQKFKNESINSSLSDSELRSQLIATLFSPDLEPGGWGDLYAKFKDEVNLHLIKQLYIHIFLTPSLLPYLADFMKIVPLERLSLPNYQIVFNHLMSLPNCIEIVHHLINKGVSFSSPDANGNKILHNLVSRIPNDDEDLIRLLKIVDLFKSAENHSFNTAGLSPLFIVCQNWVNASYIKEFIKLVPDPHCKNSMGRSALYYIYRNTAARLNSTESFTDLCVSLDYQRFSLDNTGRLPLDTAEKTNELRATLHTQKWNSALKEWTEDFLPYWAYIPNNSLTHRDTYNLAVLYLNQAQIENCIRSFRRVVQNNSQHSYSFFNQVIETYSKNAPLDFKKIRYYLSYCCDLKTISTPIKPFTIPVAPQNYFTPITLDLQSIEKDNSSSFFQELSKRISFNRNEGSVLLDNLFLFYQKINTLPEEISPNSLKNIFNLLINILIKEENSHVMVAYSRLIAETSSFSCSILWAKELRGYLQLLNNSALHGLLTIYYCNKKHNLNEYLTKSYELVRCLDRIMHHKPYLATPIVQDIEQITEEEQNSLDQFYQPLKNNFNYIVDLIYKSENESNKLDYIELILKSAGMCATALSLELQQLVNTFISTPIPNDFEQRLLTMLHSLKLEVIDEMGALSVHQKNHIINLIGQEIGLDSGIEDPVQGGNEEINKKLKLKYLTIFFQNFHICRIANQLHQLIKKSNEVEKEILFTFLNQHIVPNFLIEKYEPLLRIAASLDKGESIEPHEVEFFKSELKIKNKIAASSHVKEVKEIQTYHFYKALTADLDNDKYYVTKQKILMAILSHFKIVHPIFDNLDEEYLKL